MKSKYFIPFLIAFLFATTFSQGQEVIKSNCIAISINSFGNEKSFKSIAEKVNAEIGFSVKTQCTRLNIIVFEYNSEIYRDRSSIINYLKEKGYAFEVREGLTAENIYTVCKDNTHTEKVKSD